MGNTDSNVTSRVRKQADNDSRELYSLANCNGGGELVNIVKEASMKKDFSEVDKLLKEKVEPFLYNGGQGKMIPITELVLRRNSERPKHKQLYNSKNRTRSETSSNGGFGGQISMWNISDMDQSLMDVNGDLIFSRKDTGKYREICFDLDQVGNVGENLVHLCLLNATSVHAEIAKRLIKIFPKLINDIYLQDDYYAINGQTCVEYGDFSTLDFTVNPGGYNASTVTQDSCLDKCSSFGYGFSATEQGNICLCGNANTGSPSAKCNIPCAGDAGQICGGPGGSLTVLEAQNTVSVGTMSLDQNGDAILGVPVKFTINSTECFGNRNSTFIDGKILIQQAIDSGDNFEVLYYIPGEYNVVAKIDSQACPMQPLSASKKITVQKNQTSYNAPKVLIDCPENSTAGTEFTCELSVLQGTDVKVVLLPGTSMEQIINDVPDPQMKTVGNLPKSGFDSCLPGTQTGEVLMKHIIFHDENAHLVGFEVCASQAGDILLEIYRPECGMRSHCSTSNTCKPICTLMNSVSCDVFWCSEARSCSGVLETCPAPSIGVNNKQFSFPFTVKKGCQFLELTNSESLKPGDFLAYQSVSGFLCYFNPSGASDKDSGDVDLAMNHAVQAVYFQPSNFTADVTLNEAGNSSVNVSAEDIYSRKDLSNDSVIIFDKVVGLQVNYTSIYIDSSKVTTLLATVEHGSPVTFELVCTNSSGIDWIYTPEWKLDEVNNINHTFEAGIHDCIANAYNDIGGENFTFTLYSQNPLPDQLNVTSDSPYTVYSGSLVMSINVTSIDSILEATNATCFFEWVGVKTEPNIPYKKNLQFTHDYSSVLTFGNFTFRVNCSNEISTVEKTINITVNEIETTTEMTTTEMTTTEMTTTELTSTESVTTTTIITTTPEKTTSDSVTTTTEKTTSDLVTTTTENTTLSDSTTSSPILSTESTTSTQYIATTTNSEAITTLKPITFRVLIESYNSITGEYMKGAGPNKNIFNFEYHLAFTTWTDDLTGVDKFQVVAEDDSVLLEFSTPKSTLIPSKLGSQTIFVHPYSLNAGRLETAKVIPIVLQEPNGNLSIIAPSNADIGAPINVDIMIDSLGSDSCLIFRSGDIDEFFYGKNCPNLVDIPPIPGNPGVSTKVSFSTAYFDRKVFTAEVELFNDISKSKSTHEIVVGPVDCVKFISWIENNKTLVEAESSCVESNKHINLYTEALIQCKDQPKVKRIWTIISLKDNTKINNEENTFSQLTIKENSLEWGSYRVTYMMELLDVFPPMKATKETYICIKPAIIVPKLIKTDESYFRRGPGQVVQFDPEIYSTDMDPTSNEVLKAKIFCRCLSSNENYVFTSICNVSDIITPKGITQEGGSNLGGCFGNGPGAVDFGSNPLINLKIEDLDGACSLFEFTAAVTSNYKSVRRCEEAKLEIEVASVEQSILTIMCENDAKCQQKGGEVVVKKGDRLAYVFECESKCGGDWEAEILDENGNPLPNQQDYVSIQKSPQMTSFSLDTTGLTSKQYKINVCIVENGVENGCSAQTFNLNHGPTGGSCYVDLSNNTIGALIQMSCDDNWVDEDKVCSYAFYIENHNTTAGNTSEIFQNKDSPIKVSETIFFPNQVVTLYAEVKDCLGAFTTVVMAKEISTPPESELVGMSDYLNFRTKQLFMEGDTDLYPIFMALMQRAKALEDVEISKTLGSSKTDDVLANTAKNQYISEKLRELEALGMSETLDPSTTIGILLKLMNGNDITESNMDKIHDLVKKAIEMIPDNTEGMSPKDVINALETMSSYCQMVTVDVVVAKDTIPGLIHSEHDFFDDSYKADFTGGTYAEGEREALQKEQRRRQDELCDEVAKKSLVIWQSANLPNIETSSDDFKQVIERVTVAELSQSVFENVNELAAQISSQYNISAGDNLPLISQVTNSKGGLQKFRDNFDVFIDEESESVSIVLKLLDGSIIKPNLTSDCPIKIPIKRYKSTHEQLLKIKPSLKKDQRYLLQKSFIGQAEDLYFMISPKEEEQQFILAFSKDPIKSFFNETVIIIVHQMDSADRVNGSTIYSKMLSKTDFPQLFGGDNDSVIYTAIAQVSTAKSLNSTSIDSLEENDFTQDMVEFELLSSKIVCSYFDEEEKSWQVHGMKPFYIEENAIICCSNHLTTFGSGFFVMPNSIDFDYVFANANVEDNITIYVTVIVSFALYLILLVYARRKDRKDIEKLGATPIPENNVNDAYLYEILVFTGNKSDAGTDSKISFVLSGELNETGVRSLVDKERPVFCKSSVDSFILSCSRPLGALKYLRIWHDNSGKGKQASWYLDFIVIRDVQTGQKYQFLAHQWFAVEYEDGAIDRMLPVSGKDEISGFSHLFSTSSSKNLRDGHLWLSIFLRPPRTRFTRVQRLSSCMALLYLSMLVNIMWYGTTPQKPTTGLKIGPFSLSPAEIGVGVMSNIIVFVPSVIIITLFRRSRPRKLRPSRVTEALNRLKKDKSDKDSDGSEDEDGSNDGDKPNSGSQVQLVSKNGNDKKKKSYPFKNKKFTFPWWCIIIAWILTIGCIGVSLFFLWAYGITFGNDKTTKWFTSLIISTLCSIFLTQPIKVVLLALIFSMVCKDLEHDQDDADEDEEDPELAADENWMHVQKDEEYKKRLKPPKLLNTSEMIKAREQRAKELEMYAILKEIVTYFLFLWILLTISYGNRDPNAIILKETIFNIFLKPGDIYVDFYEHVRSEEKLYRWMKEAFLPELIIHDWYNGAPPNKLGGYLEDRANFVIGIPILRQVRVKKNSCPVHWLVWNITENCGGYGHIFFEEDEDFGEGWNPDSTIDPRYEFRHMTAKRLKSLPFWGILDWYGGSGYVYPISHPLREKLMHMSNELTRMKQVNWIDGSTRALFLEFCVYNAQVNLFSMVTIVAEFLPGGGIIPNSKIDVFRLQRYHTGFGMFVLVCEVFFMIFVIYHTIHESICLVKQKKRYFKNASNMLNLSVVIIAWSAFGVFIQREVLTHGILEEFKRTNGTGYIRLQHVGAVDEVLGYLIAFMVFLENFKFLNLLRFNKRLGILSSTLKMCAEELSSFGVCLFIVFLSFVQLFYLILGLYMADYATFISAIESTFSMMLGKFKFREIQLVSPFLGPFVFFIFGLATSLVLINILLTIVIKTFDEVKNDVSRLPNDYEMVEFISNRVRAVIGLQRKHKIAPEKKPNRRPSQHVDELPKKVEKLVDYVNSVCATDTNDKMGLIKKSKRNKPAMNNFDHGNAYDGI